MKFSEIISFVRESLRLTQKDLAEKLGVSFATVNRWEQGLTEPHLNMQKKVIEFCETNKIMYANKQKIGFELISATQIENWFASNQRKAQEIFPELIQNLIKETVTPCELRFPHGDKINSDGFDGILKVTGSMSTYVPNGESAWELGATTKTSVSKIIADYKKREAQTSTAQKKKMIFILVTPVSLSTSSLNKIRNTIKSDSWKEIKIYTSIEICDWLSSCLATTIWLYKIMCGQELFLDTLVSAHNKLIKSTTPQLSSKIFTASRESEKNTLIDNLKNKKVIKVAGPSFYEAYGFVLSAMIESNLEENNLRTVICNDYNSLKKINDLTKNKILILKDTISNYNFSDSQNIIVIIYGKDISDNKIDIQLGHRAQSVLSDILKNDMNVSSRKISQLSHSAKNNVFLIARALENESSHTTNPWRNRNDLSDLIPILMLGKINVKNKEDKDILNSFLMNGETSDQYLSRIKQWEKIDNSPILIYGDYIKVSLKEELWISIASCITEQTEAILFASVKTIFSKHNPKYDLPKEKQFAYQIYNKVWQYNNYIVEGLLDSCVLLAIYNEKQNEIDVLFGEILESISTKEEILTISDYMKLIAECSPEKYLSYVEKEIKKDNSLIWELFADNDVNLLFGGGHNYCNLLWSLETLCAFDEYKIRACSILLNFIRKNFTYKILNTPAETLASLLWFYNTKTALSIKEKLLFIEHNILKYGKAFIPYAINIIFKTSGAINDSSLKWRDPELKDEVLTYFTLYNAIDKVIEAILNKIDCTDIDIIKTLIDNYLYMTETTFKKIAEYITNSFSKNTKEAISLYEYLLLKRYNAIKYHQDTSIKFIGIINPIISWLKPDEKIEASLIYFKYFGYNDCPIPETIDNNFEKEERASRKFQRELFFDLFNNYEHTMVLNKVIDIMPDSGFAGQFLSELSFNSEDKSFAINKLLESKKYYILSNFIVKNTAEEINIFINGLDDQVMKELLPYIQYWNFVPERVLKSEELTRLFYRHRQINELSDETEISLIKKYNPSAYFIWILHENKEEAWDVQEIMSVMFNINNENVAPSDYYFIEKILRKLDENYYNVDLVRLEFMLFPVFEKEILPNGICRYFTENPNEYIKFMDLTRNDLLPAETKYNIISRMRFPKDFTGQNIAPFISCFLQKASGDNIKDKATRQHLGEILARSFRHSEKEYLPNGLKELLEKIDDFEVNRGVYLGYENSRGVRTITDGTPEIEQALRLEAEAKECEISYPCAAQVLRMLAYSRRRDAAMDKEERMIIDGIL